MKVQLLILTLLLCSVSYSQWAKALGGTGDDNGYSIAADGSGNVYVSGNFTGTADFDPSSGTYSLTSAGGSQDIFIAKYNSGGSLIWAKALGGTSSDYGQSIAVDGSGNVYVCGYFSGTADFDPSGGTYNLISAGGSDIFFAKYDANGSLLWANALVGTSSDYGRSIAVDGSGNVYVTGTFAGTVDFDPSSGTSNPSSSGGQDIFIAKYNSGGSLIWANAARGTSSESAYSIAVDGSGNVYVTGSFNGTVDFDPSVGIYNLIPFIANGYQDIFFAKYNSSGSLLWAKALGGPDFDDIGYSIAVDGSGNVYLCGIFSRTADFDPSAGTSNLESNGYSQDIFFAKYDVNGSLLWAKALGGANNDFGYSVAVDGSGNVYVTGGFYTSADFDPSAGTYSLTSAGGYDNFFAKYNSGGSLLWAKASGGTGVDFGRSIAVDGSGNVYVAGYFQGAADFDPSGGTSNLTSAGGYDIFLVKYRASDGLLPVELNSFSASALGSSVSLYWKTATEVNNYGFDVERWGTGDWEKIGFVKGHGNSNSPVSYSFTDENLSGSQSFEYRLKQIDNDGGFKYSDVVNVNISSKDKTGLSQNYPNPFNPSTAIKFSLDRQSSVKIKIYDLTGCEIKELINDNRPRGSYILYWNGSGEMNQKVSSGIYVYRLIVDGQIVESRKMGLLK